MRLIKPRIGISRRRSRRSDRYLTRNWANQPLRPEEILFSAVSLNSLTIDAARTAIQEQRVNATSLAQSFYTKIEKDDPQIGAYLTLARDRALDKAAEIDALAAKGADLPPLAGVPIGIKDVMVTRGVRTTAGSKIIGNYIPPYDSTAVARL